MGDRQLNRQAAEIFRECAGILQHQSANPFRVNAYIRAANVLDALQDDSLEALENAAHDGSLMTVPGIGERRAAAIRAGLVAVLGRGRPRRRRHGRLPAVRLLLEIDAEYRKQAAAGVLPKIAPKRFNPEGKAWLPILHAEREGWHFTALFSNTARAHQLGRTDDWVVIYFYDGQANEFAGRGFGQASRISRVGVRCRRSLAARS